MRVQDLTQPYVLGMLGMIFPNAETDRFENKVSLVQLPSHTYRMVHHTPMNDRKLRATIYAGRGKSIKFESFWDKLNDGSRHTISVGGIATEWQTWTKFKGEVIIPDTNLVGTSDAKLIREYTPIDHEVDFLIRAMNLLYPSSPLWIHKPVDSSRHFVRG